MTTRPTAIQRRTLSCPNGCCRSIANDSDCGLRAAKTDKFCNKKASQANKPSPSWSVLGRALFGETKELTPDRIIDSQTCSPKRRKNKRQQDPASISLTSITTINYLDNFNSEREGGDAINPYRMLMIRKDATRAEIKKAYRRLALLHHPGRICTQSGVGEREKERRRLVFTFLAACCETLLERDSRTRLDSLLKGPHHPHQHHHQRQSLPTATPTRNTSAMAPATPTTMMQHDRQRRRPAFLESSNRGLPFPLLSHASSSDSVDEDDEESTEVENTWANWACLEMTPKAGASSSHSNQQRRRHSLTTCSTEEMDHVHYSHVETDRLFGGSLSLLYKARMFRSFTDPFVFFERIFGRNPFPAHQQEDTAKLAPSTPKRLLSDAPTRKALHQSPSSSSPVIPGQPLRSATAWTGSQETLKDGSIIYTTCHTLPHRKVIKRERLSTDPRTGQKRITITVTGEDFSDDDHEDSYNKRKTGACDESSIRKAPHDLDLNSVPAMSCWNCCGAFSTGTGRVYPSGTASQKSTSTTRTTTACSITSSTSSKNSGHRGDELLIDSDASNHKTIFGSKSLSMLRRMNCVV